MVIYKYPCNSDVVEMPKGAKVLSVGVQYGHLQAWALVDPSQPLVPTLRVVGTGHPVNETQLGDFMGTHIMSGGALVWHVFKYSGT